MECPACGKELVTWTVDDIDVDVCDGGCGGLWFDIFELQKVDERQEAAGEKLLRIPCDKSRSVDFDAPRGCPKCDDVIMMRHFYSVKHQVEVDECGGCGGFWLDCGELAQIRNLFESSEQEEKATQRFFASLHCDLDAMTGESEHKAQKAERIARLFRFICPSFYIPGKQKGAAF